MTVLIVDDDETNRKLLRVTLEAEGMGVVEAADGVEALAVLERQHASAIISDILMPRMDGYRLCYEVRADKRFQELPFIVYTNTFTSARDEKVALDIGADKFIRKPAQARIMVQALHKLAEKSNRSQKGDSRPPADLVRMKDYSEALVRKLEGKNSELQLAGEQLMQANRVLADWSRELERTKEDLRKANEELEERVRERTAQLEAANNELEAFGHSVAHDLRAPLRAVDGYCRIVLEEGGGQLNAEGAHYLRQALRNIHQMNELIDALLKLSHISRKEMRRRPVDLSAVARSVLARLQQTQPERRVKVVIAPEIVVMGDEPLLRIALENLLNNAWKFTAKQDRALIEVGTRLEEAPPACFVRDNGAGFDMAHAKRLFAPFQRLHSEDEFSGTGIGLATVQRIIRRHRGHIWAEGAKDKGATFYFTL